MAALLVVFFCHPSFCELPLFLSRFSAAAVLISPVPWCAVKQPASLLPELFSLPAQHAQGFTDLENLCVLNSLFCKRCEEIIVWKNTLNCSLVA